MHLTGLLGMPRRAYTYPAGWAGLAESRVERGIGADRRRRGVVPGGRLPSPAGGRKVDVNPWNATTLEWLPLGNYGTRSIPLVESREPLWDRPSLRAEVDRGEHYLPGTATGRRETLVTSWATARPEYVAILPGPGWSPLLAAIGTAAFFLLLTVQLTAAALVGGLLALTASWYGPGAATPGPGEGPVEVARGVWLPTYMTGHRAHSWWAMLVVIAVLSTTFVSLVFSYAYLWLVGPEDWPPAASARPSGIGRRWRRSRGWAAAGSPGRRAGRSPLAGRAAFGCGSCSE